MKTVFMGTPDFAVKPLEAIANRHDVVCVVTRADKSRGRGNKVTPSPVKQAAQALGLNVFQPETLRDADAVNFLRSLDADIFIVAAFGMLLPADVLDIPRYGCVNIHASLLPKYRGAAPINRAIMNGDEYGGVSIMYMAQGLDTGDVILQKRFPISGLTAGEYHDLLSSAGSDAILEAMAQIENGTAQRIPQDDAFATYASKITKEELWLDFDLDSTSVCNKIKGLSPAPGARFTLDGRVIKALDAHPSHGQGAAGELLKVSKEGIEMACREGSVTINLLVPEGRSKMTGEAFYAGYNGVKRT